MEDLYSILKIPSHFRTAQQLDLLVKYTQNIEFFSKMSSEQNINEIHKECCRSMTLETFQQDEFIFRHREVGEKFYIIFTGSVSVKVPSPTKLMISKETLKNLESVLNSFQKSSTENDSEKLYKTYHPHGPQKLQNLLEIFIESQTNLSAEDKVLCEYLISLNPGNIFSFFSSVSSLENEKILIDIEVLQEIGILYAGSSFGELALLSNKPRSACIQARERTILLVLNKSDFKKILGNISERKLISLVKMLQKIQYFHGWSKSSLTKIAYYLEPLKYKKGQNIYKENDPVQGLYFIKDGEVVIEKRSLMKSENFPVFSSSPKSFEKITLKKKKPATDLKIIIKSKYEAFGGFEVCELLNKRSLSAVCFSANCEVLFMKKEIFLTRIPNFEVIREIVVEENQRIVERFNEIVTKNERRAEMKSSTPLPIQKKESSRNFPTPRIRISSTSKNKLVITKKISTSFIRKLTKQEVEEAVNGRSSVMRIYGSKQQAYSSFGNGLRQKLLPLYLDVKSKIPL